MPALLALNSNCVKINALTVTDANNATTFVDDAVADITLQISGVDVTGETWPLNIPYVAASDGNYFKELSADIGIVVGDRVDVTVNAVSPSGTRTWTDTIRVTSLPLGVSC